MDNGKPDFLAQVYELRLLMSTSINSTLSILHKFPEHGDRLATPEWHLPFDCPAFPLDWHPSRSGPLWTHPRIISGRTVLKNELVLESDNTDYDLMADATRKALHWLEDHGSHPWLVWSGNKSYHVHSLFTAPACVPEELLTELELTPDFDVGEAVRDFLKFLLEKETSLKGVFDPALTHWSSSSHGRMIRMPGSIHPKSGMFCTVVDAISDAKPSDLPIRNLTELPAKWDITPFSGGIFEYVKDALEQYRHKNAAAGVVINLEGLTGSIASLPPKLRMIVEYLMAAKPLPPHNDAAHRLRGCLRSEMLLAGMSVREIHKVERIYNPVYSRQAVDRCLRWLANGGARHIRYSKLNELMASLNIPIELKKNSDAEEGVGGESLCLQGT